MTGFATQGFAPLPDDRAAGWQDEMQSRLHGADAADGPLLTRNLRSLINQSVIIRWKSGGEDGFAMFVDWVIAGPEARARQSLT